MLIFQHDCWFSSMSNDPLSRRERQVMNIIYARGQATAAEIHEALPDPPTFSATRAVIRTLEEKGHITSPGTGLALHLPTRRAAGESASFGRVAVGDDVFSGFADTTDGGLTRWLDREDQ